MALTTYRILAADDDPLQLDLRRSILEAAGHHVVMALSAGQTAAEMSRGQFHLVVMDLRLLNPSGEPDAREGIQLIRRIRELDARVPILVLSGWPQDLDGYPEERMVSRIMMKPVKPGLLLQAARELLSAQA